MSVALSLERETELLRLARSSRAVERDAGFDALMRELGPPLLSLCIGVTGQRADGEDALQEALCTIAVAVVGFRGEARLSTWCYRIALRAALRVKASRVRRAEAPATEAPPEPANDDDEPARRLREAVGELPIDQRAVVLLFLEGRASIARSPTFSKCPKAPSGRACISRDKSCARSCNRLLADRSFAAPPANGPVYRSFGAQY